MMVKKIFITGVMFLAFFLNEAYGQKDFLTMNDFRDPLGEWFEGGDVKMDPDNGKRLVASEGEGVFINGKEGKTTHFVTKEAHGDVKLELEFMIPEGSNSGVYLQGRYEIQVLDSWGRDNPGSGDCGGIYERWDDSRAEGEKGYEGTPPPVNACKKPGEWQHLLIKFKAPRFNAEGEKIKNAVFKKVKLNGITLHRNVEVTGPTRSSLDDIEAPTCPLMLQGDHGPVAYRNIRIK
jgi:hypothetical protein